MQLSGLQQYSEKINKYRKEIIEKLNSIGYTIPNDTKFSEISSYLSSSIE